MIKIIKSIENKEVAEYSFTAEIEYEARNFKKNSSKNGIRLQWDEMGWLQEISSHLKLS